LKKKPSLSYLEDKLDKLFSQYIRRSHADAGGTVRCVTCPKLMFWKEADCGHWVKRQHRAVRWDERNVGPQCSRCNHFMGGVQDEFSQHIIVQHGLCVHDELLRLKHTVFKVNRVFLEDKIQTYKQKLEELPA
jgi:hypothetical protein